MMPMLTGLAIEAPDMPLLLVECAMDSGGADRNDRAHIDHVPWADSRQPNGTALCERLFRPLVLEELPATNHPPCTS